MTKKKLNIKFKKVRKRFTSPSVCEYRDELSKKRQRTHEVRVAKLSDYNPSVINTADDWLNG